MTTENEATPVDVGISDAELFNEANADTPAIEPAAEAKPETPEQARDEKGQFAAKDKAEPEPKPESSAEQRKVEGEDANGQIPAWRLREEREARDEARKERDLERAERAKLSERLDLLQRQNAVAQQPKPEQPKEQKPDPLIDPEGYEKYIERKFEDRLLGERRETSLANAHRAYKKDFEDAYTSAQEAMSKGDVALAAKMQRARDPGETLMEWHREQKVMREVGTDPSAWLEKKLEERMSDPAFLAKAVERAKATASTVDPKTQRPLVNLPPSLANMSRAETSRGGDNDTDISDEGLFRHATS